MRVVCLHVVHATRIVLCNMVFFREAFKNIMYLLETNKDRLSGSVFTSRSFINHGSEKLEAPVLKT